MKIFRFPLGHADGETLTVGELKTLLANYPDHMPVLATWEGILTFFGKDENSVFVKTPEHWHKDDLEPCLIFDVDQL